MALSIRNQFISRSHYQRRQRCRFTNLLLHLLLLLKLLYMFAVVGNIVNVSAAKFIHNNNNTDFFTGHYKQAIRRSQRDLENRYQSSLDNTNGLCEHVKEYFATMDIEVNEQTGIKGSICNGSCCSNATETFLRQKAAAEFERLLHFNTKSLRSILVSTAILFRDHVLELTVQSEHKTLFVFSQVYRRMVPLSTQLIRQLYTEIRNHLTNNNNMHNFEDAIQAFFVKLFPVAYHQAVNINKENYGDLHEDYITCLQHTFDDLQPFGSIPKEIKHNLIQSVQTAQILINALEESALVLSEIDDLYGTYMTDACTKQLLKMNYCPSCNGLSKGQHKPCNSYCMNVMRGCSVQYVGVLDNPWSNVVDAIDNLFATHIHADTGIILTIKQLDHKLSEAIMQAMQNGPDLEKKVKKTCGTPKLLATSVTTTEVRSPIYTTKWATPPDAEILRFLSTIEKSKEFYSNIVNNVCDDDDILHGDNDCWTGDRVGDYIQSVMTTGVAAQRYNPEVPLELNSQSAKFNEIVDKLIKIRKNIGTAVSITPRSYSDIQSDMARHDDEGSGHISDDIDDEEYGNIHESGDGSGDGSIGPTPSQFDPVHSIPIDNNGIDGRASAFRMLPSCFSIITLMLVRYI